MTYSTATLDNRRPALLLPLVVGTLASVFLPALYLAVVSVAQSWSHALQLVGDDRYFVAASGVGFGVQVGLFVHLRRQRHGPGTGLPVATTGASTGTSTVAMLACCSHHLTEVFPALGISAAAVFLNDNRVLFMILGLAGNIAGIVIMLRLLYKRKAHTTALADHCRMSAELRNLPEGFER